MVAENWESVFEGSGSIPFNEAGAVAIGAVVEYGDYAETSVWAYGKLPDGRWFYVEGSCDTTGWDCQSSKSGAVSDSFEGLRVQMTDEGRLRLGIIYQGIDG